MQYAEALREVKKAESEVRDLKLEAERSAAQVLREAERQANAMLEGARTEAESAFQDAVEQARLQADKNRDKTLKAGEQDAAAVRARTTGPGFKQAVDILLANFEKHVSGK